MLLILDTEVIPENISRHFIFTRKLNSAMITSHESKSHGTHAEVEGRCLGADLPSTLFERGPLCCFISQASWSLKLLDSCLLFLLPVSCRHAGITDMHATASGFYVGLGRSKPGCSGLHSKQATH